VQPLKLGTYVQAFSLCDTSIVMEAARCYRAIELNMYLFFHQLQLSKEHHEQVNAPCTSLWGLFSDYWKKVTLTMRNHLNQESTRAHPYMGDQQFFLYQTSSQPK